MFKDTLLKFVGLQPSNKNLNGPNVDKLIEDELKTLNKLELKLSLLEENEALYLDDILLEIKKHCHLTHITFRLDVDEQEFFSPLRQFEIFINLLDHFGDKIEGISLFFPCCYDDEKLLNNLLKGMEMLLTGLRLTNLKSLTVNASMDEDDTENIDFLDYICTLIINRPGNKLESLCLILEDFPFDFEKSLLEDALRSCINLKEFHWSGNYTSDEVLYFFDDYFLQHSKIEKVTLDLSCCGGDISYFSGFLDNKNLRKLNISVENDCIGEYEDDKMHDMLEQYATSIETNTNLKELDLYMDLEGVENLGRHQSLTKLMSGIAKNNVLTSVSVGFNTSISGWDPEDKSYCVYDWTPIIELFKKNYTLLTCSIDPILDQMIAPFLARNNLRRNQILHDLPTLGSESYLNLTSNYTRLERYFLGHFSTVEYIGINKILLSLLKTGNSLLPHDLILRNYSTNMLRQLINKVDMSISMDNISEITSYLDYQDFCRISQVTGGFFFKAKKEVELPELSEQELVELDNEVVQKSLLYAK